MKLKVEPVSGHSLRGHVTTKYFDPEIQPSREDVRTVACPKCHAGRSDRCMGRSKPRISNHEQRVKAYKASTAV